MIVMSFSQLSYTTNFVALTELTCPVRHNAMNFLIAHSSYSCWKSGMKADIVLGRVSGSSPLQD